MGFPQRSHSCFVGGTLARFACGDERHFACISHGGSLTHTVCHLHLVDFQTRY